MVQVYGYHINNMILWYGDIAMTWNFLFERQFVCLLAGRLAGGDFSVKKRFSLDVLRRHPDWNHSKSADSIESTNLSLLVCCLILAIAKCTVCSAYYVVHTMQRTKALAGINHGENAGGSSVEKAVNIHRIHFNFILTTSRTSLNNLSKFFY